MRVGNRKPTLFLCFKSNHIFMFGRAIKFCVSLVQKYLPEPFIFAIILTLIAFVAAIPICRATPFEVLTNWSNGLWSLLAFSMQMALVLVCGSALAEAPPIQRAINRLSSIPKRPHQAIALVTVISSLACWINWGFGLIIGVVLAKELAKSVKGVDYRLLIASSYSGFVVWHSGISGSIPLAMSTGGDALREVSMGTIENPIPLSDTIFSLSNLLLASFIIITITIVNSLMHPKKGDEISVDPILLKKEDREIQINLSETPAQKLENSIVISSIIGVMGLTALFLKIYNGGGADLNFVIALFLFTGILLHIRPMNYIQAIGRASSASAGIILQFPFYAGIMGIMTGASSHGVSLAGIISDGCISISNADTFPVLSFLSAGLVNIFVPSGGGQWAVQAPIMLPAAASLGVSPAVTGMAIAWGDAWTNLIQPFWALPALGLAKLGARDIMGYCLVDLIITGVIIILALLFIF